MRSIDAVIYANHAGTSWPKPPGVADAVADALAGDPRANADRYRDAHAAIARWFALMSRDDDVDAVLAAIDAAAGA